MAYVNRFDRKSFKQASRRKANDLLDKIKNLFGKEVTLDKICFDNEYCIDFDGTVGGKSAYISIAIEKWPGYTGVTVVIDNDVFSASVRGGASEAAKYLSENFTILSGEDKLFKEAKDHDEALRTGSRDIASRRKADDYYQLELDFDGIKWYELEPGYDFDDEEIDGERAVKGWQPNVNVDAASLGTVYQLDDGRFEAVGNDEFTRFKVLGYFDNIEEAKQAVIESMEADGWLPEYRDVADKPSKHTGPLPTRKNSSVRKYADDRQKHITNRAIAGKHSGDSDVSIYMKKLKNCLEGYWDGVQYLEDYYDGENMHEEAIFLDDENGDTHFVELEFEYADIEDGDPCFLVCPFEEYMWAFEVDATLDPLRDARSITKALNDEIRSLS